VEQWLRQAHVHRMRGQWAQSEALCRRALEVSPDDAMGRELMGDLLAERGDLKEAAEQYQAAQDKQPKPALEEKIGRMAVLLEEQERARIATEVLGEAAPQMKPGERKRRATMTALLILLTLMALGLIGMISSLSNWLGSATGEGRRGGRRRLE